MFLAPFCRLCQAGQGSDVGPILHPKPAMVGGEPVDLLGLTFRLRRCQQCGFLWKHPPIPEDRLLKCYAASKGQHWGESVVTEEDARRRHYDVLRTLLVRRAPGRRILDVGCFNGQFLNYLGPEWERLGVEPSLAASQIATQSGIRVLGSTLTDVTSSVGPFDAITAIDVVEHIVDPLSFFVRARGLLRSGGVLLIVTGDTDTFPWRLLRNRTWYCTHVEHVSFYNRRCLGYLARRLGMENREYLRLPHARPALKGMLRDWTMTAGYLGATVACGFGIPWLRRKIDRGAPSWLSACDHLYHVMVARPEAGAKSRTTLVDHGAVPPC